MEGTNLTLHSASILMQGIHFCRFLSCVRILAAFRLPALSTPSCNLVPFTPSFGVCVPDIGGEFVVCVDAH